MIQPKYNNIDGVLHNWNQPSFFIWWNESVLSVYLYKPLDLYVVFNIIEKKEAGVPVPSSNLIYFVCELSLFS